MAKESVLKLERLEPERTITGHGAVMEGEELKVGLEKLVNEFEELLCRGMAI